jgi:quaternary ammonium compound-resistance protein SugE
LDHLESRQLPFELSRLTSPLTAKIQFTLFIFGILTLSTAWYLLMSIYWISLLLAGFFEIGWPLGLKLADLPNMKLWGIVLAISSMALSGFLLWFSLKEIPIGTAYAIWTSIGAIGTFTIGVLIFGDPNIPLRWVGVALILLGVILLKMG